MSASTSGARAMRDALRIRDYRWLALGLVISQVTGPAIGAALLAAGPPQVAFYLNAGSFLLSAAAVSRVRTRSRPSDVTEGGTAGVLRQVVVGFRAIASSSTGFVLVLFSVMA